MRLWLGLGPFVFTGIFDKVLLHLDSQMWKLIRFASYAAYRAYYAVSFRNVVRKFPVNSVHTMTYGTPPPKLILVHLLANANSVIAKATRTYSSLVAIQ